MFLNTELYLIIAENTEKGMEFRMQSWKITYKMQVSMELHV